MKQTKIDLSEPFEKVLGALLSAPQDEKIGEGATQNVTAAMVPKPYNHRPTNVAELREVLRCLYEAAHGRQVATQIGLVAIAPPVAPSLKETPFYIKTQVEFLVEALTRIISSASHSKSGIRVQQRADKRHVESHARNHTSHIERKNANARMEMQFQPLRLPNGRHFSAR